MRRVLGFAVAVAVTVGLVVVPAVGAQAATATDRPDCSQAPAEHMSAEFVSPAAAAAPETDPAHPVSWWGDTRNTASHGVEWSDQVAQLKALCVNQVILQWSAQTWAGSAPYFALTRDPAASCVVSDGVVPAGEPGSVGRWVRPLYASANAVWDQSRVMAPDPSGSCVSAPAARSDQVGGLLAAAKAQGMRVWLGLQIDESTFFGSGSASAGWMAQQAQLSKDVFDDLWTKYGATYRAQIAGVYLPFEGNNIGYSTDASAGAAYTNFTLLNQYTDTVSNYIAGKVPGLGVMVSPFHVADVGADLADSTQQNKRNTYASVVAELLRGSSVSVYAPQDGAGAQFETTADIAPWMVAARHGITAAGTGTKLWGNAESYSMQGANPAMPIQLMVSHLHAMNDWFWGEQANIDGYAGFSANNLNTAAWWWDTRANRAYAAAYATYLSHGLTMGQTIPAVGTDSYPGNTGVTAALIQGSYDVTVQWPRLVVSTPTDDWRSGIVIPIVGYQVFRDGQPIGGVRQPLSDTGTDRYGFPAPLPVDASHTGVLGFTDPNVQSGRTFTYQVSAVDAYGNSSPKTSGTAVVVPLSAADTVNKAGTTTGPSALGERVSAGASYATVKAGTDPLSGWNILSGDGAWQDGSPRPKLADGVTGEANYADPAWAGLNVAGSSSKQVTLTLAAPTALHQVRSNWLVQSAYGISEPQVAVDTGTTDGAGTVTWTPFTSWKPDPGTGINVAQAAVGTMPAADPGTGWLDATLDAGQNRTASLVRLTVTGRPGSSWAFLSEITLIGADGNPVTPCATPNSTTLLDSTCVSITDSTASGVYDDSYKPFRPSKLTAATAASVAAGNPPTDPWASASSVGWDLSAGSPAAVAGGLDLVVDLGQNQPVGTFTTDWYTTNPSSGIRTPAAVTFAYQTDTPGRTPNLTSGWTQAPATSTITAGGLTSFRSNLPKTGVDRTAAPSQARWIKAHITLPTTQNGWVMAASTAVYTPPADDLTNNRPTTIYPTQDTSNTGYDPTQPTTTTNNITKIDPTNTSLKLPTDASLNAVPALCTPPDADCSTHSSHGNTTLTATDPTTGKPVPNNWTSPWVADANLLILQHHTGWDITVPVGGTLSAPTDGHSTPRIDATTLTFTEQAGQSTLPATIDVFFHSQYGNPADPYGIVNDAKALWQWSGHTARKPITPPYIPKTITLITTYTIPPFATPNGVPIAKLRLHINTTNGNNLITGRLHTTVWQ